MTVLYLSEMEMRGALSVDTGAGEDRVALDCYNDNVTGIYNGPVKVALGAGADVIYVGLPGDGVNRGVYHGTVLFDGGAGNDMLERESLVNTFYKSPKEVSFMNVL